jgi:hypothetical protein
MLCQERSYFGNSLFKRLRFPGEKNSFRFPDNTTTSPNEETFFYKKICNLVSLKGRKYMCVSFLMLCKHTSEHNVNYNKLIGNFAFKY